MPLQRIRLLLLSSLLLPFSAAIGADVVAQGPVLMLRLMAEGFVSPTAAVSLDAKAGTVLVADQPGRIRVMEKDGTLKDDPFLDLGTRMVKLNAGFDERGLLGLALHPKFRDNRRLFLCYSAPRTASMPAEWDSILRVSEFLMPKGTSLSVDVASERVVLEIEKPYFNHNGGAIAFGPDGFLYIAVGDGGNGNGEGIGHSSISNGQDLNTLLGKMLRIDVDRGRPYGIPKDNPYAKGGGRPEIFAYGFRNPYRFSFDRGGSRGLYVGDVGQTLFEEVNLVKLGGNYGWFLREGAVCFDPKDAKTPKAACPDRGADGKPLLSPVIAYKNPNGFRNDPEAVGISVIGGYVYRGSAIPGLQGRYVFGDWSRNWAIADGQLLVATAAADGSWSWKLAAISLEDGGKWKGYITAFGEDGAGELYVMSNASNGLVGRTGKIFKLVGAKL